MNRTEKSPTLYERIYPALSRRVRREMRHLHVPGVAVGLIHADQELTAGFGVTNLENPLPVNADTLFQIGSITKTITATAAMRLVDSGKLDLEAPVRTYLPDLRLSDESVAVRLTLRHLFSHTGGWAGDYFDDLSLGDDALQKIVAKMASLPQLTPLGQVYSYNNAGFYIAGRVLEAVYGKPYETTVKELVLDPLGMDHSFFFAHDAITYRVAAGHEAVYPGDSKQPPVARPWAIARTGHAIGGLSSTIQDLLKYARFQMGDGRAADGSRVLRPESMALMQAPYAVAANGESCGVSWFSWEAGGVRFIRHGGATNGQTATFVVAPARRFAFITLTNSDRGDELYQPLRRWVLKQVLGVIETLPKPVKASESDLAPLAGHYQGVLDDLDLEVRQGVLVMQVILKGGFPSVDSPPPPPPPPVRMGLCSDGRLIVLDEPGKGTLGEFLRDPEGRITWLRFGGRIMRKA